MRGKAPRPYPWARREENTFLDIESDFDELYLKLPKKLEKNRKTPLPLLGIFVKDPACWRTDFDS